MERLVIEIDLPDGNDGTYLHALLKNSLNSEDQQRRAWAMDAIRLMVVFGETDANVLPLSASIKAERKIDHSMCTIDRPCSMDCTVNDPRHPTCIEITNGPDVVRLRRTWMCGLECSPSPVVTEVQQAMTEGDLSDFVNSWRSRFSVHVPLNDSGVCSDACTHDDYPGAGE